MKKSISFLTLLVMIGSVSFASGSENPKTNMALLKSGSTIKLLYKADNPSDVKVLIFNDNHQVVFTERIKNTDGFVRPYDFSRMPDGKYSIQLIDPVGEAIQHLEYKSEERTSPARSMSVIHAEGASNKFIVSVPNRGEDEITITISDGQDVLYTETATISGDFARLYNLKDYAGEITFKVTDRKGLTNSMTKVSR